MSLNVDALPVDPNEFQAYLDELKFEQLPQLKEALQARFRELRDRNDHDDESMARLAAMTEQGQAVKVEMGKRESATATARANETAEAHKRAIADLENTMFGTPESNGGGTAVAVKEDDGDEGNGDDALATQFASIMAKAFAKTDAIVASGDLNKHIRTMPLSQIGKHAPDPKLAPKRKEPVLVASADIPGVAQNGRVSGIEQLAKLMGDRANMMTTTHGKPNYVNVAKLKREHKYRLNLDSTPEEINEVLNAARDVEALVAAGGWCAPSEISYDFFNIVAEDGLIDLPTVGVLNRGGFRYPVSPSIADVFAQPDALFNWTEEDDISAETPPGPTKPCFRVPCPTFEEVRAACDGFCVTAGNLTDFAYPELIANWIRLVMAARAHVTNQSILQQLDAASTPVTVTANVNEGTSALLGYLELQAVDYRNRFRMSDNAVLEAVLPNWAPGVIRHDLSNRSGVDLLSVSNDQIADWFNLRQIRVQFVQDWQSGFAADTIGDPTVDATAWPTTVDAMIYAAGTFVRGQALQLDLGVVRDSTLNETNDHTAAWVEDCYAVAEVGHESRLVTIPLCTDGVTGANQLACTTAI